MDVQHPKNLFSFHSDLPFLPERKKIEKCNKLVCDFHEKKNYVVHIKALKQALNHGLIPKKMHRVIQFNQKAWLKPYVDMSTKLTTEAKNDFEKDFFKLMNNAVFGKTMENVRNHRDIKLVTTAKRRYLLVSEPNYHTSKHFSENLTAIETKKTKVKLNQPIYLGISIIDISTKNLCINFGIITLNQSSDTKQNYTTWILTALLFILKPKIFMNILLMTLRNGLTHLTMMNMIKDLFQ